MEIPDDLESVIEATFSYDRTEVDGTLPEHVPASLVLIRAFSHKALSLVNSPPSDSVHLLEPSPERDELLIVLSQYLEEVAKSAARAQIDSSLWFSE